MFVEAKAYRVILLDIFAQNRNRNISIQMGSEDIDIFRMTLLDITEYKML